MTVETQSGLTDAPAPVTSESRSWKVAVAVLAVALVALGAWAVFGPDRGSTVPADVEAVIERFQTAWEDQDIAAFEAVVTRDILIGDLSYVPGTDLSDPTKLKSYRAENDLQDWLENFANDRYLVERQVEIGGDFVVSGDGPWFVAVEEVWTEEAQHTVDRGTALYVIVEQDGELRVADYRWAGLRTYVGFGE